VEVRVVAISQVGVSQVGEVIRQEGLVVEEGPVQARGAEVGRGFKLYTQLNRGRYDSRRYFSLHFRVASMGGNIDVHSGGSDYYSHYLCDSQGVDKYKIDTDLDFLNQH